MIFNKKKYFEYLEKELEEDKKWAEEYDNMEVEKIDDDLYMVSGYPVLPEWCDDDYKLILIDSDRNVVITSDTADILYGVGITNNIEKTYKNVDDKKLLEIIKEHLN